MPDPQPDPLIPVLDDIADLGALTRSLSGRYEAIFRGFRAALAGRLDQAETMADAALQAMEMAEATAAAFRSAFPNQPALACTGGCAACCHLFVAVPPGVAEAMAAHIAATHPPAARDRLIADLRAAAAAAASMADPARLRRRCPLLGADDRCTVYDVRPPACRAFTSTSAARCRQLLDDPSRDVPQNAGQYRLFIEATAALQDAARHRALPAEQQGLAAALLAALDNADPDG
ncbi:YkgJ family cysteine cluster protein (plasmid) [Tistrella mobilis]|uniref:YkgJ family cysteine cluster protein n=1 Tax=Tistrella mobilis TaxID=171437 RepID=UPI003556444B